MWARIVTVVVLAVGCGWGQQKQLNSAPLPHFSGRAVSPYSVLLQQSVLPKTALQRSWYWEANILAPVPSLSSRYLPKGVVTGNSDFSPASLQWTFTGKRKLMPVLDLTLIRIKPGEGMIHDQPGPQLTTGPDRGHFWNWATQSISGLLHTE